MTRRLVLSALLCAMVGIVSIYILYTIEGAACQSSRESLGAYILQRLSETVYIIYILRAFRIVFVKMRSPLDPSIGFRPSAAVAYVNNDDDATELASSQSPVASKQSATHL
jgi:hypothetical protein